MSLFVKLPCYTINLEQIRLIEFEPDPPLAVITWAGGEEATLMRGLDAIALMAAVEQPKHFIDVSTSFCMEELLEIAHEH